ncbi:MAG: trigger factor [Rickettsiaceae bacterium]|nr:MAG: trigger factor [Rickettsiaceae bacterium]
MATLPNSQIDVTELKNEGLDLHVQVKIPLSVMNEQIESEITKIATTARIKGFRTGKVPLSTVERMYGNSIRNDVLENQVGFAIKQVSEINKIETATKPKIENFQAKPHSDVEFLVKFERIPEIDIPDLTKIAISKPVLKITETEVKERILKIAQFNRTFSKESKAKIAQGDQVTLDAIGYVDGKAFDGGKLQAHKLIIGSKSFIDNFEDQLIGKKKGEEVVVKVMFPAQYHAANLANKAAEFNVTILAIHKADPIEINQEYAEKLRMESVEALEQKVKKDIEAEFTESIHTMMKMELFDQLEAMLDFDVPSSLVEKENQILKLQTEQVRETDLDFKDKSEEEFNSYYNKLSFRRIRIGLLIAKYVKNKNLHIEQEDIQEAVIAQAKNFPGKEMAIIEYYSKHPKALEDLKGPILEEKGVKHMFDHEVKIEEKEFSVKQFEQYLEKENERQILLNSNKKELKTKSRKQ